MKSSIGSFELPVPSYIIPKLLSFLCKKNIQDEKHKLSKKDYDKLIEGLDRWGMIGFINRVGSLSIEELHESIMLLYNRGFRYFVLDHLNYFIDPEDSENNSKADAAMILLQKLVKTHLDMGICLVVHPRKVTIDLKTGQPRPITRQDFKGSSRIIQDADNIWIMNQDKQRCCVRLTCDKLRSEKTSIAPGQSVDIYFDKEAFKYTIIPVV